MAFTRKETEYVVQLVDCLPIVHAQNPEFDFLALHKWGRVAHV